MTGYITRQSTITTGNTIKASDFNDEYNAILGTFSNTTGHIHDGSAGEGGRITEASLQGGTANTIPMWGGASTNVGALALATTELLVGNGSGVPTAVAISGDATMANTGALTITGANLNFAVGGTLGVTGISTLASAVITAGITVGTTLGVTGVSTLASAVITGAATVGTTLGVTGVSTLASAVITGAATVGTTLGVTGTSTLGVVNSGNTAITGTLSISAAATLASAIITAGATIGTSLTVGTTLATVGDMSTEGDMYIGVAGGSGNTELLFRDNTSATWRGIRWEDAKNKLALEQDNGVYHAIAAAYTATSANFDAYPIGSIIACTFSTARARNAVIIPRLDAGDTGAFTETGASSILSGTWHSCGETSSNLGIVRKVAM